MSSTGIVSQNLRYASHTGFHYLDRAIDLYPFFPQAASTRFRLQSYLPYLRQSQVTWRLFYPILPAHWGLSTIHQPRILAGAASRINSISGLDDNLRLVSRLYEAYTSWPRSGNVALIQKPLYPGRSPVLERTIRRRYKRVVFDLDDALFFRVDGAANESMRRKISTIASLSDRLILGNSYLRDMLSPITADVTIIPTPVKVLRDEPKSNRSESVTIGWIGQASNYRHLHLVEAALGVSLSENPNIRIKIVGGPVPFRFKHLESDRTGCSLWSESTEESDLLSFDIGIMPLLDDAWSRGKCSFKLLQYMSAGIPSVASPVGMNKEVISHGTDGFLASSVDDWVDCLRILINDQGVRQSMGSMAIRKVRESYSPDVWAPRFIDAISMWQ